MAVYDWVVFDYGGTLTTEIAGGEVDPPTGQIMCGEILAAWFAQRGIAVAQSVVELQKLTEEANRQSTSKPGQESLTEIWAYHTQWMRWIYRQVGVDGYIPLTELESARLYFQAEFCRRFSGTGQPSLHRTLAALQGGGARLGVISNNAGYVSDLLATTGIHDYFEFIIDSARVGIVKPDRAIFDLAVTNHDLSGRLLYVGDSFVHDVIGATSAGWDVAWITDDTTTELPAGAMRITNLADLLPICSHKDTL